MEIQQISKSIKECVCSNCGIDIPTHSSYVYITFRHDSNLKYCSDCGRILGMITKNLDTKMTNDEWIVIKSQFDSIQQLCSKFNVKLDKLYQFYNDYINNNLIQYDTNIYSILIQYIITHKCIQNVEISSLILSRINTLRIRIKNEFDTNLTWKFDTNENLFIFKYENKLDNVIMEKLYVMSNEILQDDISYYFI